MRHQLWGIDPRAATAALAEQSERLSGQIASLEALLRSERSRTAELRKRQAEQAEALARAEAEVTSLRHHLSAASAEIAERRRALQPETDPEAARQEERVDSLRRRVERVRQARAELIRGVSQQLLRTEAGETDGEEG